MADPYVESDPDVLAAIKMNADAASSKKSTAAPPAYVESDPDVLAAIKMNAQTAATPGTSGIDPVTKQPYQFLSSGGTSPVAQSTGTPIAEGQLPGAGTQAAISLGGDPEQRRRIAAAQLYPDLSPLEAQSHVFYGSDGRLAAVGSNGKPFYVDPIPANVPGLGDVSSPASIASSLRFDNPLQRVGSLAGEIPANTGAAIGGALTGGNPAGVGIGAAGGDLVRTGLAHLADPAPTSSVGTDLTHAAVTGASYGALDAAGRVVASAIPSNALEPGPNPLTGPLSTAARVRDDPTYVPPPPTPQQVQAAAEGPRPAQPIKTQADADSHADKVIQYFAGAGNKTATPTTIPGTTGTLADVTGNVGLANLQRGYAASVDSAPFADLVTKNNAARGAEIADIAGVPADIKAAQDALDTRTAAMRQQVFANTKPSDVAPVVGKIDQILASPEAQEDSVKSAMTNLRAKLVTGKDADGNETYQTDPAQLYGIRKAINTSISPAARGTASDQQLAARQLIDVRDALDPAIESGAPGFQKYIDTYSEGMRPINGMQYLQGLNLTDRFGDQTAGRLDQAIKQIDRQQALPGARPADSISDEQYQRLMDLRDSSRQEAKTQVAGKVNSGTFQDMATNSRVGSVTGNPLVGGGLGLVTGAGVGELVGSHLGGTAGAALGGFLGKAASETLKARQLAQTQSARDMLNKALLDRLLNVDGKGEAALQAPP